MADYARGLIDGVSYFVVLRYADTRLTFRGNFWNGSVSRMLQVVRAEISERFSRYGVLPLSAKFEQLTNKE